jgi:hypothetical protein
MKKPYLYIFGALAIVICVLAVATLSYAGGSKVRVPLVTSGLEAIMANLVAPGPQDLSVPSTDYKMLIEHPADNKLEEDIPAVLKTPESWKRFSFKNYSFKIPSDWEPVWPSVEQGYATLLFQDAGGATVANLWSPTPTTGYPGHIITETKKTIKADDHNYKVLLVHGDPDSVESNLDMIVISKLGYESDMEYEVFDPGYGMQIFSRYDEDASEIFQEIYDSLEIVDAWQTFTGDHFRFEYPDEWIVTTDAGVGHRWIEFFGTDNKKIASMRCPIPETGYIGYEMTETNRTLTRGDMKYALDYWHGDDLDGDSDLELILMETMTPREGEEGGFGGNTCQLTAEKENLTEVFERIYQSVTVR